MGGPAAAATEAAPLTAEELAARERNNYLLGATLVALSGYGYYITTQAQGSGVPPPSTEHLVNWSGTHECQVARYYQPETVEQLEELVKQAHEQGERRHPLPQWAALLALLARRSQPAHCERNQNTADSAVPKTKRRDLLLLLLQGVSCAAWGRGCPPTASPSIPTAWSAWPSWTGSSA